MVEYTLVVTSCGRFDLLKETLQSFYAYVDIPPTDAIVVEDSTDARVSEVLSDLGQTGGTLDGSPIRPLINAVRMGQMRSIDRAYAEVRTPYIFHCEDDWRFTRGNFIAASAAILEALPGVSMVGLRPREELNPLVRRSPMQCLGEIDFFQMDPSLHPEYFSHSFNPGLRRTADYHRLGPYAPLGGEEDVSYTFKKAGFRIANLEAPAVCHIGWDRHIDDPMMHRRARTPVEKLLRSVRKRVKRVRRSAQELLSLQPLAPLGAPPGAPEQGR